MLIIAILVLLLAVTSSTEINYNYLADYVKFNRIVFIIFILSGYLAYNTLDVEAFGTGVGIYGGVFKITVLSQVFDIILFTVGAIVTILTCFIPYHVKVYNDNKAMESYMYHDSKGLDSLSKFYHSYFKNYYYDKLINYFPHNNMNKEINIYEKFINIIKSISSWLPEMKMNFPFLVKNKLDYSKLEVKEYSFLLLYTVLGGSLLISSQNLISLYLSLELQSFTLYILSTSQIRSFRGTSGGLKYFLLGGLSSGFILLGCSLLYAYTGTLYLDDIFMIYSNSASNYFMDPCLLILFAGLLFKVSAAPFHHWAPDVYSDVPTYSTTWLIIIAKLSIFIFMLVLVHNIHTGLNLNSLNMIEEFNSYSGAPLVINEQNGEWVSASISNISTIYDIHKVPFSFWNPVYSSMGLWTNVLTISAFLSLVVGTVLGISQSRIKRLFAYSTVTHVGFLLLALSINSISSIDAFIFYLIQYTVTNLNLFFILVAWGYLYSRYYLEKDLLPIRYLNMNPYSWKDYYIEPTLYDFGEFIKKKMEEDNLLNDHHNNDRYIKINSLYKGIDIQLDQGYYDFDSEESEWLYTPVPFLTNFKGMYSTDPYLAFCLAVTIFSLAGIPPLIGFFAKQQVLLASMQLDYYFLSIVAIFTSVIGAAYYLRIVKFIYFYDDAFIPYYIHKYNDIHKGNSYSLNDIKNNEVFYDTSLDNYSNISMLPSNNLSLVIAGLTNISLFYILKPYIFMNGIYMITIPLFQGLSW
jgi:NADH:ubiquinone oxidoreductase subunit 2 (subunit N)